MKQIIKTVEAPQAIGPYSQAIVAGGFVFASGQIPLNPLTGEFVEGGIVEQTEQVLRNLSKVLEAAGTGLSRVVKTTVYLADMSDFAAMNEVYGRFFELSRRSLDGAGRRVCRATRGEIDVVALAGRLIFEGGGAGALQAKEKAGTPDLLRRPPPVGPEKKLGRFGDLAPLDAGGADLHPLRAALRALDADGLQVRVEAAARAVVSV